MVQRAKDLVDDVGGLEGRVHRSDLSFLVQRLGLGGVTYGKSRNW